MVKLPAMFEKTFYLFMLIAAVCAGCREGSLPKKKGKVYIDQHEGRYTLIRNGKPFLVKGAAGMSDLEMLQLAGANTIRTWDTLNLGFILDSAYAHNIAVIAGFPMPVSGILSFYNDTAKINAQYAAFSKVVENYRSHPALLMWCLGNEVDFPYSTDYRNFYRAYNRLLRMIHDCDPDHPVTTALIGMNRRCIYNIRWKVPDLDLISFNIFSGLTKLESDLDKFSWFWEGPFLITEWGINGPWESEFTAWGAPIENTSTKKAEQYLGMYQRAMPVNNPRFLGSCVFYWGQKQEVTHTWYSLFSENGATSETVNVMHFLWSGKWPAYKAPALKYMLLEGKGARDNLVFDAGTEHFAEILFQSPPGDSLSIHWEILEEDWYRRNWYEINSKKPATYDSLLLSRNADTVRFRSPHREGPYRIFATVYDRHGHFASANTPFYVIGR